MLYSIILPTYNERENLPIIFYLIQKYMTKSKLEYEVVIVDDSSPDGTYDVAKSIQTSFGEKVVTIVSRKGKLGLGTAYSAGLQHAKGQRIVLMDADMSHHPQVIPEMVQTMTATACDIVTGSRYRPGGGVYGWDTRRKLTSRTANFLADFLLHPGVSDLTGSFRLYERAALELILPQVISTGYAFQMEIMIRANQAKLQITEVPIIFVDRMYGESKLGTHEILMYLKGLITLFFTT